MDNVTYKDLQNWPFKLGASFRLLASHLLENGWNLSLFEQNESRNWAYFLASKGSKTEFLGSLKQELYTNLNSRLGYLVTINKARTYEYVKRFNIAIPESLYLTDEQLQYGDVAHWQGVVIKPVNGSSGNGITTQVADQQELDAALAVARSVDVNIVAQEFVSGDDHRLLFIDYKLFAVVRREPASVVGDGTSTVRQLIKAKNAVPKSDDFKGTTSDIVAEEVSRVFGAELLERVPGAGEKVTVSDKANLSLGGDAYDVTDVASPAYESYLAPMIRSLGLRVCGVDILTSDISVDPHQSGARLLEVNAAPNLRPHLLPTEGVSRDAAQQIAQLIENEHKGIEI